MFHDALVAFAERRIIIMIYAPILIPTLCRYDHLVRCIESLKKNGWAKYTDVYVALDYPLKEEHWDGYRKIKKYLKGDFSEFANFNVIIRNSNYGSGRNMVEMREDILKRYDRFIRTDDDCEFSPNFIEYMDKCLERYEHDPTVMGVTGYSYPIKWIVKDDCNAVKNNSIFPMWGTGFWRDKFILMQNNIKDDVFEKMFSERKIKKNSMTVARWIDVIGSIYKRDKQDLMHQTADVSFGSYIQIENQYIITPIKSLVRNYGFDGSGVYCQNTVNSTVADNATTYDYLLQEIDCNLGFDLKIDESSNPKLNRKIMDKFDRRSPILQLKTFIKQIIIQLR